MTEQPNNENNTEHDAAMWEALRGLAEALERAEQRENRSFSNEPKSN
jgi:hypothetical protein